MAGIGLVVALYFGEQFAALVVPPEVLRFAPIAAARGMVGAEALLVPAVAAGYLLVALLISSLLIERGEIT